MHGGRSEEEKAEGGVWLVGSHRHRPHSSGIEDMEVAEVREEGRKGGVAHGHRGVESTQRREAHGMGGRSSGVRADIGTGSRNGGGVAR
jgi:hypothetical protein